MQGGKKQKTTAKSATLLGLSQSEQDSSRGNLIHKRTKFTEQEDELIRKIVEKEGKGNWKVVAQLLLNRSQRTVRQRWAEHLDPSIKTEDFSTRENFLLWLFVGTVGQKWATIAKHIEGRPPGMLKNKWAYFDKGLTSEYDKICSDYLKRGNFKDKTRLCIEIQRREGLLDLLEAGNFVIDCKDKQIDNLNVFDKQDTVPCPFQENHKAISSQKIQEGEDLPKTFFPLEQSPFGLSWIMSKSSCFEMVSPDIRLIRRRNPGDWKREKLNKEDVDQKDC